MKTYNDITAELETNLVGRSPKVKNFESTISNGKGGTIFIMKRETLKGWSYFIKGTYLKEYNREQFITAIKNLIKKQ
jgi:hypothetical protein